MKLFYSFDSDKNEEKIHTFSKILKKSKENCTEESFNYQSGFIRFILETSYIIRNLERKLINNTILQRSILFLGEKSKLLIEKLNRDVANNQNFKDKLKFYNDYI